MDMSENGINLLLDHNFLIKIFILGYPQFVDTQNTCGGVHIYPHDIPKKFHYIPNVDGYCMLLHPP
jgi:hypothetical protein